MLKTQSRPNSQQRSSTDTHICAIYNWWKMCCCFFPLEGADTSEIHPTELVKNGTGGPEYVAISVNLPQFRWSDPFISISPQAVSLLVIGFSHPVNGQSFCPGRTNTVTEVNAQMTPSYLKCTQVKSRNWLQTQTQRGKSHNRAERLHSRIKPDRKTDYTSAKADRSISHHSVTSSQERVKKERTGRWRNRRRRRGGGGGGGGGEEEEEEEEEEYTKNNFPIPPPSKHTQTHARAHQTTPKQQHQTNKQTNKQQHLRSSSRKQQNKTTTTKKKQTKTTTKTKTSKQPNKNTITTNSENVFTAETL